MPEQRSWWRTWPPANALGCFSVFGLMQRTNVEFVSRKLVSSEVSCPLKCAETEENRAPLEPLPARLARPGLAATDARAEWSASATISARSGAAACFSTCSRSACSELLFLAKKPSAVYVTCPP